MYLFGALSGADMYPGRSCGHLMPRARWCSRIRPHITAACSKTLCCRPVPLILSHDSFAKHLPALFRSDVLTTSTAYAAATGALQTSPWAISARTMRAILFASATRTSMGGFRVRIPPG